MSYSQIFRRISRLFQSSVNSILSDEERDTERAFDDELRRAEQKAHGETQNHTREHAHSEEQRGSRGGEEPGGSSGQRRPGEKDDAFYLAVLGLTPSAGNDEIRKAYRKMMAQYHPDKVATLGPELQAAAAEKSKEINEAYMIIERRRGMK